MADSQYLQSLMAHANGESLSNGPPALSTTPTFTGIAQALRRRWVVAVGLATLAALLAVAAVFQIMPPKYMVTIRFRVAARSASPDDVEFPIFKANMEWLAKSPLVINAALNEKLADGREIKDLELIQSKGLAAVDWLEKALKSDYVPNAPEILRVTLPADQPDEAAELLNAIAKAFLNEYAEMERSKRQQRLIDLRKTKDKYEEDIRVLRNILKEQWLALEVKDASAMNVNLNSWLNKLAAAETAKRANDEEIVKSENELISLKSKLKTSNAFKVPEDLLEDYYAKDSILTEYAKAMVDCDKEIRGYFQKYNEPHSSRYAQTKTVEKLKIKYLKEQREKELLPDIERKYRARAHDEISNRLSLVKEKFEEHKLRGESLQRETQELERKVKESGFTGMKPVAIAGTEDKIDVAVKGLNQTAQKIGEVELEVPGSRIFPLERANAPATKDSSRQVKYAGAGSLGVFGLALFGVALLEFRSRKISTTNDVTHGLGLNVLGTVPAMPTRSRKATTQNSAREQQWQNQLHESVDAIRTVVLHTARKESMRVIMVTSANSGEGKTTLATQLAASLARAWKRTLIIDGDLRHPATHKLFEVPQEPGLSEILRGEVEIPDAVRATSFSRLWVLPAGNSDGHAIQALAQDTVSGVFETLKEQYDFIIVDSPPVLPVTDTLLLGQHVDGVLLAILRDVSRAPAVYAAQQRLAPLGVHTLGSVVIGTQPEFGNQNYRYTTAASK